MIVIGKSKAALTMICDIIASLPDRIEPDEIHILNNLNLPDVFVYSGFTFKETLVPEKDCNILGAVMPETKKRLVSIYDLGYQKLIHNSAIVSWHTLLTDGVMIDALVSIAGGVKIGSYVTIYANSIISHDCEIGDYVTICPGVTICGGVEIGEGTFIGAGSIIKNGISIGKNCIIGCGSNVINDVKDNSKIYGNPAK